MALPVAAIVSIVFGAWALLVLILFAVYQFFKKRGSCSSDCAPCGKENNGQCSDCCISLSESCDCDCCKPSTDSCLDSVCPKNKKISCVDIILCQCCAGPGEQPCCLKAEGNACSCCSGPPSRCFGGPFCEFRPCACGDTEEDSGWRCNDICCCECNFKQPVWMPHGTPSTQSGPQPRELMNEISRLSSSGYKLQFIGPDGEVRTLDTTVGPHSSRMQVPSVMSSPQLPVHNVLVSPPRGYYSHTGMPHHIQRLSFGQSLSGQSRTQSLEGFRRVSIAGGRVLPPVPQSESERRISSGTQSGRPVREPGPAVPKP